MHPKSLLFFTQRRVRYTEHSDMLMSIMINTSFASILQNIEVKGKLGLIKYYVTQKGWVIMSYFRYAVLRKKRKVGDIKHEYVT